MSTTQFLVILMCMRFCSSENGPKVSTKLGVIEGSYAVSSKGMKYHAFEGIPYALPPIGDRRFEVPEPVLPWSTVLKAQNIIKCLGSTGRRNGGVENCLYLNIYAPPRGNSSLPVIVFIHGGAFQFGSYTSREPYYLIDHDIIYVTINYRLGVLGFLSTEDEYIPGNMGLKDQALGLKWIKENIESFGGDPSRVTLTGSSAGAASVHYHYLSSMSSGLFHAGISFSGTSFDCWAQTENSRQKAIKLAAMMNCPTNDTTMLVQCLKKVPAETLAVSVTHFKQWIASPLTPFGPVVEKPSPTAFITRHPAEIINSGVYNKVPWITGFVSEDGLCPTAAFAENKTALQDLDDNWDSIAPFLLDFDQTSPKQNQSHVAKRIRDFYFGKKHINDESFDILTQLAGDRLFKVDAVRAAIAQAKTNQAPVWLYSYSYRAANSFSEFMAKSQKNYGVSHVDDVFMVLGNDFINPSTKEDDYKMHEILLRLWISVAHNSTPEVGFQWPKVDSRGKNVTEKALSFLNISSPLSIKEEFGAGFIPIALWDSMGFDENKIES